VLEGIIGGGHDECGGETNINKIKKREGGSINTMQLIYLIHYLS
jgi:hypothetical protein